MDKIFTPSKPKKSKVNMLNRSVGGPSPKAINFLRQFARVYTVEAGFGLILN